MSSRVGSRPRLGFCALLLLCVAVFLGLAGCGSDHSSSTSNNNPTPGSSNSGGNGGSGGTGGSGGSGGTGGGSGGGTASTDISGTVVDSATGKPISGTVVVDLEAPAPGDYTTLAETTADSNGKFSFKNVAAGKAYAVVISASSGGNYYVPAIVAGGGMGAPDSAPWGHAAAINPGTDLGTIAISLPNGPSTVDVGQPVTSKNAAGQPTPVTVQFTMRELVTDWVFTIPWPVQSAPSVTTGPDPSCESNTDCAAVQLTIPAGNAVYAPYDPSGLQFSSDTSYDLNIVGTAFLPNTTTPDCTPQRQASTLSSITPGQRLSSASLDFTACQ